jgi:transposase
MGSRRELRTHDNAAGIALWTSARATVVRAFAVGDAAHRRPWRARQAPAAPADLGITAESLRTWVRKDESQAVPGRRDTGSEVDELARLRAENRPAAEG